MQEHESKALTSVRLNPRKKASAYRFRLQDPVAWSTNGFYLEKRPSFTFDPIFHGGAYYVQEPSSMIIEYIMSKLQFDDPIIALDLCGAPGGKSTLLSASLKPSDVLVANEVIHSRFSILNENMVKWGFPNVLLTNHDPKDFQRAGQLFDLVLVDAPCSGEGLWRKDPKAKDHWSDDHIYHCSIRQKRILGDIIPAMKPGGYLIYSTCTFNDLENIDNVNWLMDSKGMECLDLDIPSDWQLSSRMKGSAFGYQVDPSMARGEGFFFAVLQKPGDADKKPTNPRKKKHFKSKWGLLKRVDSIQQYLKECSDINVYRNHHDQVIGWPGNTSDIFLQIATTLPKNKPVLDLGVYKRELFIPGHALSMSIFCRKQISRLDVDYLQAIHYLQRSEVPDISADHISGWALIVHENINLGWIKKAGHKIKNRYPMHWRIKKRMD